MGTAQATVHADDERVRVTTWSFADRDATGHHRHEFDYIVVPVTGGTFDVIEDDGSTRRLVQEQGVAYRGRAGTTHDVVNNSQHPAVFVEIELKR